MTEQDYQLLEGDRVQLVRAIQGVTAGTYGTILRRFTSTNFFDVRFDGLNTPRIVPGSALVPVAPMDAAQPDLPGFD